MVRKIVVAGSLDDLVSTRVRFLQEAARLGPVQVLLWSDEVARQIRGSAPKFPQEEREYFLTAMRYVNCVSVCHTVTDPNALPPDAATPPAIWVVDETSDNEQKRAFCRLHGFEYQVIKNSELEGFPNDAQDTQTVPSSTKKVLVTGCYDWFHSGHVRFFEEVSELGKLYVVVGHDANIKLLKGEGHPMHSEQERRYMAQSVRHVKQALVSSGDGWLDAEPEIERIKPDIYAVNEDGDRPEKREFCEARRIEYRVLKRVPKQGLPKRQSTDLRGF